MLKEKAKSPHVIPFEGHFGSRDIQTLFLLCICSRINLAEPLGGDGEHLLPCATPLPQVHLHCQENPGDEGGLQALLPPGAGSWLGDAGVAKGWSSSQLGSRAPTASLLFSKQASPLELVRKQLNSPARQPGPSSTAHLPEVTAEEQQQRPQNVTSTRYH